MITEKDHIIENPININHDINNLLFRNIDYTSEELHNCFVSRDVGYVNLYEKKTTFSEIVNDCSEPTNLEINRFENIILKEKETGDNENDEDINKLIQNITMSINKIKNKIRTVREETDLLTFSIPFDKKQNFTISQEDKEELEYIISVLGNFSKEIYREYNL